MTEELNSVDFLRDLAERLMHVPVMYGTDQGDVSRLYDIARELEPLYWLRDPEKNEDN